ncbi:hypothetical protein BDV12DRAFT_201129 [Aspergillus spectabilis]
MSGGSETQRKVGGDPTPQIPPSQQVKSSIADIYTGVTFTDITNYESWFNFDTHGFELASHVTTLQARDFDDPELITTVYYAEIEAYLREYLGADRVRVMQHVVRERPVDFVESQGLAETRMAGRSR